jgi:serine/threonine protein kinase/Tol biopolymer transport system component
MADSLSDDPLSTLPAWSDGDDGSLPPARVDRYHLLGPIGRGGSGVVLAAYDPDLDRAVALKIVATGDPDAQAGLLREARAAARLAHEHVVAVFDVGVVDDRVWIAMERVEGANLREWLETPRPRAAVLDAFVRAGRGLAAAHRAGIVHSDFKPENVLVGRDGRVRVADFGLARLAAQTSSALEPSRDGLWVTRSSSPAGTPLYMAPEQLSREPLGPAVDQFAFCVALYRAIAGQHPFAGADPAAWLAEMNDGRVRRWPRGCAPGWLQRLVERGLRRDPRARFESMDALLEALDRGRGRAALLRRWVPVGLVTGALAVVVVARPASPGLDEPLMPREVRMTRNASENNVVSAAISPDGKRIAWSDERGKLFVRVVETGESHAVAAPGPRVESIAWAPDGSRLILVALEGEGKSLWSVSIAKSEPSRLASDCGPAAVARGSGRIACVTKRRSIDILDGRGARSPLVALAGHVDLVPALSWSPDEERLAYVVVHSESRERRTALETIATSGGAPAVVVEDIRLVNLLTWAGLTWLPDGRLVYALSEVATAGSASKTNATMGASLWARAVSLDGTPGEPSLLATVGGSPGPISVTTDGTRMAYVRLDRQIDVYVAALARPGPLDAWRFTLHDGVDYPVDFARDGSLLFISDRQGHPASLFQQRLDEHDPTVLVPDVPAQAGGSVTPDGRGLVWFRPVDQARGRWQLIAVDEPTQSPRVVAESRQSRQKRLPLVRCATVSSGPCVVAEGADDNPRFVEIDPKRGRVRDIARIRVSDPWFVTWDLDGRGERIVVADGRQALYLVSVKDGTSTPLPDLPASCWPEHIKWAPDGSWLLVSCGTWTASRCWIIRYDLEGRTDLLWERQACVTPRVFISPDARRVAFSMIPLDTDVWMLELTR